MSKHRYYHCEGAERIHHLRGESVRDIRRQLPSGAVIGYWRPLPVARALLLCEFYAGGEHGPEEFALIHQKGRTIGVVYRHRAERVSKKVRAWINRGETLELERSSA